MRKKAGGRGRTDSIPKDNESIPEKHGFKTDKYYKAVFQKPA